MNRKKLIFFDVVCTLCLLIFWLLYKDNKVFCIINCLSIVTVITVACVYYYKNKQSIFFIFVLTAVVTSICGSTIQVIDSMWSVIAISVTIGIAVVLLLKRESPIDISSAVLFFIIVAILFCNFQIIDKTYCTEENNEIIVLTVENKSVSGKYGLYEYCIETNEYEGNSMLFEVDKKTFELIHEGGIIVAEIRTGAISGFRYYDMISYSGS